LGPIIEIPNAHWAVTEWGLDSLDGRYSIDATRLVDDDTDVRRDMLQKMWVKEHEEEFEQALSVAEAYHRGKAEETVLRLVTSACPTARKSFAEPPSVCREERPGSEPNANSR
jgi:hypothetical protein